jgi:hypothetical protein
MSEDIPGISEIEGLPEYEERFKKQYSSLKALLSQDGELGALQYAAKSYSYWSLRAILAEKLSNEKYVDLSWIESYLEKLKSLEKQLLEHNQKEMATMQRMRIEIVKDMLDAWKNTK